MNTPFPEMEGDETEEVKSIAEHLVSNQPQAPCADAQIGDRVVHEVYGIGTVVSRNDLALWVKHDSQSQSESPAVHSIEETRAKLTMAPAAKKGSEKAVDPQPATKVPEAAIPLTPEEIESNYKAAVLAHMEKGQLLASDVRDLKQQQTDGQQALNEVHKALKEAQEAVVAHAENVPQRESAQQKKIEFDGKAPAPVADAPVTKEAGKGYAVEGSQVIPLSESGLTVQKLEDALFQEFEPGKKSKNVGKLAVEIKGSAYLIRDKSPDGKRWYAQLLVDGDTWDQNFAADYGAPITTSDTSAEARIIRSKGGLDCGRIVKVARKTCVLAPESHGLVIVVAV